MRIQSVAVRLLLASICGLALATPSLAGDDPPPVPVVVSHPPGTVHAAPRARADWHLLGSSVVRGPHTWTDNRIFYARTAKDARRWDRYLGPHDRRALQRVDFSTYGVLAVFTTDRNGPFTPLAVFLARDGLTAWIEFPTSSCYPSIACAHAIPTAAYALMKINKGSLPSPVKLPYIEPTEA